LKKCHKEGEHNTNAISSITLHFPEKKQQKQHVSISFLLLTFLNCITFFLSKYAHGRAAFARTSHAFKRATKKPEKVRRSSSDSPN